MLYVHMYKVIKKYHLASVHMFIYLNFTIAAVTTGSYIRVHKNVQLNTLLIRLSRSTYVITNVASVYALSLV